MRTRRTRRRVPLPTFLALVALLAAACGASASTPAGSATPPPAEPTVAPTAGPSASPAATASPSPTAPVVATPGPKVTVAFQPVVSGLPTPIGIAAAPGDPRLFVIGQAGQIVIVNAGKVAGTFLDIGARISSGGERGLLGLAFHPKYASNGRLFVRYTDPAGDLRVSEFHVSADPNRADPASERILLTIPHPSFGNHNGGRIEFGPDGFLYIGTGDGGSGGDPSNHGQSLATLLGKMLRIDVDSTSNGMAYGIPPSNPFAGRSDALPEIFAFGLRNPYSFSFDRETGDLWIGDVGQDAWEEIDRAQAVAGGGNGANFGWSVMEGNHCFKPGSDCITGGLTLPIAEYAHGPNDSNGCAVIGGYVYRGSRFPELTGRYLFGDECSGNIWDLMAAGPAQQVPQPLLASGLNLSGWGQGSDGELYAVALNGVLYQLT
jgi:glucose/arabinose dehydrogenase